MHRAAFPSPAEALLVERLCANGNAVVSLLAERAARLVGHVLFSPITVQPTAGTARPGLGLAPLAVLPGEQRRGVGTALVRAGLDACASRGCGFVVVLGSAAYYARFGFRRASEVGLANEYGADQSFMVVALEPDGLPPGGGLVRYGPEFGDLQAGP